MSDITLLVSFCSNVDMAPGASSKLLLILMKANRKHENGVSYKRKNLDIFMREVMIHQTLPVALRIFSDLWLYLFFSLQYSSCYFYSTVIKLLSITKWAWRGKEAFPFFIVNLWKMTINLIFPWLFLDSDIQW